MPTPACHLNINCALERCYACSVNVHVAGTAAPPYWLSTLHASLRRKLLGLPAAEGSPGQSSGSEDSEPTDKPTLFILHIRSSSLAVSFFMPQCDDQYSTWRQILCLMQCHRMEGCHPAIQHSIVPVRIQWLRFLSAALPQMVGTLSYYCVTCRY